MAPGNPAAATAAAAAAAAEAAEYNDKPYQFSSVSSVASNNRPLGSVSQFTLTTLNDKPYHFSSVSCFEQTTPGVKEKNEEYFKKIIKQGYY